MMEYREWQHDFVQKYDGKGILEGFAGTGKTYAVILLIKNRKYKQIVIGVPTKHLKKQWYRQLRKHGVEYPENYVLVETFNSLMNYDLECDLFVIDECHRITSPEHRKILDRIQYKYILGVTATSSDESIELIGEIILSVPMEKADIANFKVFFHEINLSLEERNKYTELTRNIAIASSKNDKDGARYLKYIRRSVVYNAKNRIQLAQQLIESNKDKTTLVLCRRISQANVLSDLTNIPSFHSKNPDYKSLEDFQNDKISGIISVGMLTEGFDKQNIQCLIIVSTAITKSHHIQSIGRAVRLPCDADIHILLAEGTTDESLLGFRKMYEHTITGNFKTLKEENKNEQGSKSCNI